MKNLHVAQIATHVADARTCVLHPANATHRQMTDEELVAAGIAPDMVRLSCGWRIRRISSLTSPRPWRHSRSAPTYPR